MEFYGVKRLCKKNKKIFKIIYKYTNCFIFASVNI